ncbi:MAG TPA: carboxylesterase family protein [Caulobacteraceae bacterium]|nr:carboxylesterase family protein [Caulobacteraceae bacterium]
MRWRSGAAAASAAFFLLAACVANAAVVHTRQGDVAGVTVGSVESFKGVPFAAPPVGDLRWRPPQPAAPWNGVRTADAFGPVCMQAARGPFSRMNMSEDCLTLNVWRPANARPGAGLPVMVWIYGGAFIQGGSAVPFYDGAKFARDGVILVSFNYRLGRFGFFAHPALDRGRGPIGNYGLMDQIAALKWVKRNIAAFGGDPDNVTIFGESAGAISVNYLMISPAAKGLFAKAISESGFGRSVPRPLTGGDRSAEAIGRDFAAAQGVKGDDAAAAAALRALPAEALNAPVTGLTDPSLPNPMLDGQIITGGIAQGFARGDEAHVPYLEGGNSYEASLFPKVGDYPDPVIARAGDPAKVIAAYGGQAPPEVAREVETDFLITEPDRNLGRQMAKQGLPAFVYHFSYVPAAARPTSFGAAHGSEIPYVFDNLSDVPVTYGARQIPAATPGDHEIATAMHAYWVAFAKTGDPDSAGGPAWPRVTKSDDVVLEFGADGVRVRRHYDEARLDLIEAAATKAH